VSTSTKKTRAKPKRPALTLREIRFAEHYVEHGSASAAYRAAGYAERPSESTWTLAARVLRKPAVQQLIHDMRHEAVDTARASVNRLVQGLVRIAFADRADLFDEHGCLLPAGQWPADVAATVEGIDSEDLFEVVSEPGQPKRKELRGHARKVRTARRTEAIKLLMQWRRMIGPDIPPLDVLLNALPPEFAVAVRTAIAGVLRARGDIAGDGTSTAPVS
jgi:phage terminase small subunit